MEIGHGGSQGNPGFALNMIIVDKIIPMGGSEAGSGCKKHPCHQQKQGVCPSCLREKLSQISDINSYSTATQIAAKAIKLSCSSSSSVSGSASPLRSSANSGQSRTRNHVMHSSRRHQRNSSDVLGSLSFRVCSTAAGNDLKKSKSISFLGKNNGKKKRGFWSKLLHLKGKQDRLMHSVTIKARAY